ncbi:MAG: hypothetical protein IK136_06090 [Oscillospiraceae bacterium]|nr:hypothetical protein [Oscillospiraceae bacterium]
MLFSKHIDPCCSYCRHGTLIGPDEVMCLKRGVVSATGQCDRFRYDPLKREPVRARELPAGDYATEDFTL